MTASKSHTFYLPSKWVMGVYFLCIFIGQGILFGFVGYYDTQDNMYKLEILYKFGMALVVFNLLISLFMVLFYGVRFSKILDEIVKTRKEEFDHVYSVEEMNVLSLALEKVQKNKKQKQKTKNKNKNKKQTTNNKKQRSEGIWGSWLLLPHFLLLKLYFLDFTMVFSQLFPFLWPFVF